MGDMEENERKNKDNEWGVSMTAISAGVIGRVQQPQARFRTVAHRAHIWDKETVQGQRKVRETKSSGRPPSCTFVLSTAFPDVKRRQATVRLTSAMEKALYSRRSLRSADIHYHDAV